MNSISNSFWRVLNYASSFICICKLTDKGNIATLFWSFCLAAAFIDLFKMLNKGTWKADAAESAELSSVQRLQLWKISDRLTTSSVSIWMIGSFLGKEDIPERNIQSSSRKGRPFGVEQTESVSLTSEQRACFHVAWNLESDAVSRTAPPGPYGDTWSRWQKHSL